MTETAWELINYYELQQSVKGYIAMLLINKTVIRVEVSQAIGRLGRALKCLTDDPLGFSEKF